MMAPEEKLKHFNRRAQACEDNQEVGIVQLGQLYHTLAFFKGKPDYSYTIQVSRCFWPSTVAYVQVCMRHYFIYQ